MTQNTVIVFDAAMSLPAKERAELAEKLLESLDDATEQNEIDSAWADESLSRLQAYDEGKMKGIPLDEVLRKLKQGNTP